MEQRTKCVLPGLGGSPRDRAATGRLTNIARKLCGASKRSSANFATFSLVCEWQRTKLNLISLWRSVARAPARPHRPTAPIRHRRPKPSIFRFENARAVHLGGAARFTYTGSNAFRNRPCLPKTSSVLIANRNTGPLGVDLAGYDPGRPERAAARRAV